MKNSLNRDKSDVKILVEDMTEIGTITSKLDRRSQGL